MNVLRNKNTRILMLIMCILVFITVTFLYFYYRKINSFVDPRILEARVLYGKYNTYAERNELDSALILMDSIEHLYQNVIHYKNSFELGVILNNSAAAYITSAFLMDSIPGNSSAQDSLMILAEEQLLRSIDIYNQWMTTFQDKSKEDIKNIISEDFLTGLDEYDEEQRLNYLTNRIDEIYNSQREIKRRLSVSYTNLGVICRHKEQFEKAALHYKKAIDLWDRNLTAENNLNILLGRPLKKRNMLQKLFPPDKDEN